MEDSNFDIDITYNNSELEFNDELDYIMSPPSHPTTMTGPQRTGNTAAGCRRNAAKTATGAAFSSKITEAVNNFNMAIDNNTEVLQHIVNVLT